MKLVIMTELVQHMDLEAAASFIHLYDDERHDWIDLCEREERLKRSQESEEGETIRRVNAQGLDLLMSGVNQQQWATLYDRNLFSQHFGEQPTAFTVRESGINEGKRFLLCRLKESRIREIVLERLDKYLDLTFTYPLEVAS